MRLSVAVCLFSSLCLFSHAVEVKIINNCQQPVWITNTKNANSGPLNDAAVVRINSKSFHTYAIPHNGWAGRLWPKVGCDGSGYNCLFGDSVPPCPRGGCLPPAETKVEFNFQSGSRDCWYDISLVDGYSLPVKVVPRTSSHGSCVPTNCRLSLSECPNDHRVMRNGQAVACLSPCKHWNYPKPYGLGQSERIQPGLMYCCPTPPVSPQQCSSGPVVHTQYVQKVRQNCPTAYSYAYDDHAGLHYCPGGTSFDVTICP